MAGPRKQQQKQEQANGAWQFTRHYIIPTFFVLFMPALCLAIPLLTLDAGLSAFRLALFLGSPFGWLFIIVIFAWGVASLKVPSPVFEGPATPGGYVPRYASNGFSFYCLSLATFLGLHLVFPSLSSTIYAEMPYIMGSLTTTSLILCAYLWWRGSRHLQCPKDRLNGHFPAIFEFYRGLDLHPRIFNVDVKQLTNCRVGLLLWQLLVVAFAITDYQRRGFNPGFAVNVALQSVYLAKFYWWETGYFTTLDITLDRAGFYLCWGCMVVVSSCYTYTSYYFVSHPPGLGLFGAGSIFALGLLAIYLNYMIDHQKELFRATGGECQIWGRKARYIDATYRTNGGVSRNSRLLLSGFWGVSRHFNYTLEIALSLCWNAPGYALGSIVPFCYNVFLFVLLVHRIYRDEEKCATKYGDAWKKYCKAVPYRLIPYVY